MKLRGAANLDFVNDSHIDAAVQVRHLDRAGGMVRAGNLLALLPCTHDEE